VEKEMLREIGRYRGEKGKGWKVRT
jgi:hypothetical protein